MMRSKRSKWLSGVGGVALIGSLALAGYGGGITPAEAHDNNKHQNHHLNPFKQILLKLDEVLLKLNGAGGGGEEGNYTSRWDTNKPSTARYTVLAEFNGTAVRDNNTGLVWEQTPSMTMDWDIARFHCLNKPVGGARGWRLPSVAELTSLMDPSLGAPYVPMNMFTGVQPGNYWSATSIAGSSNNKFSVDLGAGTVGSTSKSNSNNVWCVRGSMSESTY
ncbi:MAG: DUF1566 domain-containing protein [Nitrospira sp.]|nr:DUF1566 domain-containing protein [Nitrospira sp.]TKB72043.1 MAG: DUF1566 domain-containing protein [Nitrospira sp.]